MSKLLVPILAILVIAWLWRSARTRSQPRRPPPTPKKALPVVPCAYCGVHVPQGTAVHGTHGEYCCKEHLQAAHDALQK